MCWIDAKTGRAVKTYPPGTEDNGDPRHRSRPTHVNQDGTEIPGQDFFQGPDDTWIDAKTGQTVNSYPPGTEDRGDPNHRSRPTHVNQDGSVIPGQDFVRVPCPAPTTASATVRLETAVLAGLNAARADPKGYADGLRRYETYFHGQQVDEPGHPPAMTTEGVAAVDNAIGWLDGRMPAPPLQYSDALARAARRLADDQGPRGGYSHVGSDGSTLRDRLQGVGVWAAAMEEDISLAQPTAEGVVRQLIIDDGVPGRGHRQAAFDPGLTIAGVACGPHATYGAMCVIDFAGGTMAGPGAEAVAPPPPPPPPP
jgi:uncharacterized protein YkwD